MRALLLLELIKARRTRRRWLYVLLPLIYPLLLTTFVVVARLGGYIRALNLSDVALAGFLPIHRLNGWLVYPICCLLLTVDLWTAELADGTLRGLVLCQAPRWKILASKTLVTVGTLGLCVAGYFGLMLVDAVIVRSSVSSELWKFIRIDLSASSFNLLIYCAVLVVGILTWTLFFTSVALMVRHPIGAILVAIVFGLLLTAGPPALELIGRPIPLSAHFFPAVWRRLVSGEVTSELLRAGSSVTVLLSLVHQFLANIVVIGLAAFGILARHTFSD